MANYAPMTDDIFKLAIINKFNTASKFSIKTENIKFKKLLKGDITSQHIDVVAMCC